MTKLRYTNLDGDTGSGCKVIQVTDSYVITAADITNYHHLWIHVDSSGATDPLVITLPTTTLLAGKFVTVWVITYNKEVDVVDPDATNHATFLSQNDHQNWTASTGPGSGSGVGYEPGLMNYLVTSAGEPPVG